MASHRVRFLDADPAKQKLAIKVVAGSVPAYYVSGARASLLLKRLGRSALAKHVAAKLPTAKTIRSGDLGEILCTSYIGESTKYTLGITKLQWKDHREMAMRGEDVLAFSLNSKGKGLKILKVEVKSGVSMGSSVIGKARRALSSNKGLPSPHALSFVADRLFELGDKVLRDAIDDAQLKSSVKAAQVSHMLFTFCGNDPSKLLTTNLAKYRGAIPQTYVGLRVKTHQAFIQSVFNSVKV